MTDNTRKGNLDQEEIMNQSNPEIRGMIDEAMNEGHKKSKTFWLTILILAAIIIVMGFFLFKSKSSRQSYQTPKLNQMQEMVAQINDLETEMQMKQKEIFTIMSRYKEKTGKEIPVGNILDLSDKEQKILEEKIRNEQDVTVKTLINDIINKNNDIDALNKEIHELEALLPRPHIVVEKENHYQIAMDFLLNNKGVEKKESEKLVERAMLFDTLIPGFKVWNFYSGDEFGTFITQGTAEVSPNAIRRRAKKKLVDAKDKAISQRDQLALEIGVLSKKKKDLISELNILTEEKQKLIEKLSELSQENQGFLTKLNSLFYIVDLKRTLTNKGILKRGFLSRTKIADISPHHFSQSIDLRDNQSIVISAKLHELDKISKIRVYPRFLKIDTDYSIEIMEGGQTARINLLAIEKVKNERMVISVH